MLDPADWSESRGFEDCTGLLYGARYEYLRIAALLAVAASRKMQPQRLLQMQAAWVLLPSSHACTVVDICQLPLFWSTACNLKPDPFPHLAALGVPSAAGVGTRGCSTTLPKSPSGRITDRLGGCLEATAATPSCHAGWSATMPWWLYSRNFAHTCSQFLTASRKSAASKQGSTALQRQYLEACCLPQGFLLVSSRLLSHCCSLHPCFPLRTPRSFAHLRRT